MIDSKLNKTIGIGIKNLNREQNNPKPDHKGLIIAIGAILLILLLGFFLLKPAMTGFVAVEKQFNYSDAINLNFGESSEYIWVPEQQGILNSLKISGSYKTEGTVKVYLEDEENRYLVFDSESGETGITGITGLVVSN